MTVAALVLSIVALIVAICSAAFGYWNASVNAARFRKERAPIFEAEVEEHGSSHQLNLKLTTPWPLRRVEVTVIDDSGALTFSPNQNGIVASEPGPILRASHGRITVGESATWQVLVDESKSSGTATLRIDAIGEAKRDRWPVVIDVDIPYDLSRSVG